MVISQNLLMVTNYVQLLTNVLSKKKILLEMKSENEVNEDILKITTTIKQEFPELLKYLNEMPVTISNSIHPEINIKVLTDYYDSLDALLTDYALSHKKERK